MMINADKILTVSLSSESQIKSVLKNSNVKIDVISIGLDLCHIYNLKKDIDFICIGRYQKLIYRVRKNLVNHKTIESKSKFCKWPWS